MRAFVHILSHFCDFGLENLTLELPVWLENNRHNILNGLLEDPPSGGLLR